MSKLYVIQWDERSAVTLFSKYVSFKEVLQHAKYIYDAISVQIVKHGVVIKEVKVEPCKSEVTRFSFMKRADKKTLKKTNKLVKSKYWWRGN